MISLACSSPPLRAMAAILLAAAGAPAQQPPFRADEVVGLDHFRSSAAARELLLQQGFVVDASGVDPRSREREPLRQVFSAYINCELPPFVTVDLVLDAWTMLFERAVLAAERWQAPKLLTFSEQLQRTALALPHARGGDVAAIAGAALALQRGDERPEDRGVRQVLLNLRAGGPPVAGARAMWAAQLEPNGGYAAEPALSRYFRARRLYQLCLPDLKKAAGHELAEAFALALQDQRLRQLREAVLAPAIALVGPPIDGPLLPGCRMPFAQVADRLLQPEQGCTGLLLLAEGPFASPAGRRIYAAGGGSTDGAYWHECDEAATLFGSFLRDLRLLQQPDARAPALFRSEPWADLQCASQLAAWAQARHAVQLQAQPYSYRCIVDQPPGRVAPYPQAFTALARRAAELAAWWGAAALAYRDLAAAQDELRRGIGYCGTMLGKEYRRLAREQEDLGWETLELVTALLEQGTGAAAEALPVASVLQAAQAACASPPDQLRGEARVLLERFARGWTGAHLQRLEALAQRLAAIAERQLQTLPLVEADLEFLRGIGPAVAWLHGYRGNSWLHPNDDHPRLATIGRWPDGSRTLQAGVARPEPLYVILEADGRPQLHVGAVLSYRECFAPGVRTDAGWRADVQAGRVAPPPAFTASFRR